MTQAFVSKFFLNKNTKESHLRSLLEHRCHQIHALDLRECGARTFEMVESNLGLMKNLTSIEFFIPANLESDHLPQNFTTSLFTQCQSSLQSFNLQDFKTHHEISFEEVGNCKRLENFEARLCFGEVSRLEFHNILSLRYIKRLTIFLSYEISVEEFIQGWSAAADLSKLSRLSLRKQTVTDQCLDTISNT